MLAAMYRRILIPIDGSSTSESGLDEAIRLAFLHDGVIRLICIVQPQPLSGALGAHCYFPAEIQALLFEHAAELLRNAATRVRANCIAVDSALLEAGERSFEECLAAEARAWEADLIVIGAHRSRDVRRMPMASPASNLPRGAAVPLLLVRQAAPQAVQPLVNSWR
ncbi:universal stress protein [Achromobacter spanius]|uniref:universal stress protein n=1 Tax=Achromobacter spanius TaxID=217203 RepID=UPI00320A4BF4